MDNIDTIEKESENFYFKNLKRFLTEWHVKFKEDINDASNYQIGCASGICNYFPATNIANNPDVW